MLHNRGQRSSSGSRGLSAALAVLLSLAVILSACGKKTDDTKAPASGEGNVIAEYKDGNVTDKEFDRYLGFFTIVNSQAEAYLTVADVKEQFLRDYIAYKVLYSRVDEKAKDAASEDVDTFVKQFKEKAETDETMKTKMSKSGLTVDDAEWYYRMIVSVMENSERNVTDAEMKAIYDKAPTDFNNVTLQHILIGFKDPATGEEKLTKADALKKANEVKKKLEAGGDWKALAKEYSDDEGSKDSAGLYENKEPRQWVEAFKKAANTQKIDVIGDPVETEYGYHVIKVTKRETRTWEQVPQATKDELRQSVSTSKLSEFSSKELPGLITSINLPKDEAAEGTETDKTGSGAGASEGTGTSDGANGASKDGAADSKQTESKQ